MSLPWDTKPLFELRDGRELRQRSDGDIDAAASLNLRLKWHSFSREECCLFFPKAAIATNLKRVTLEITRQETRDGDDQGIQRFPMIKSGHPLIKELLNPFQNKLVSLRIEHCILEDGFESFTRALFNLNHLEQLYLIRVSPLPSRIHRQLPVLMKVVSTLPRLKCFGYSDLFDVLVGPAIAASLAELSVRPCLEQLEMPDLRGFEEDNIIPMIKSIAGTHDHSSNLQYLDLSCHKVQTSFRTRFYRTVGWMLRVNKSLETLILPIPNKRSDKNQAGLFFVIYALAKNTSLTSLRLTTPERKHPTILRQAVQRVLVLVLRYYNYSLKALQIHPATSIPNTRAMEAIEFYLSLNRAGRRQLLAVRRCLYKCSSSGRFGLIQEPFQQTKVPLPPNYNTEEKAWIDILMANAQNTAAVFYFLRFNPMILFPKKKRKSSTCIFKRGTAESKEDHGGLRPDSKRMRM